jgi:ribosomal protein S24E
MHPHCEECSVVRKNEKRIGKQKSKVNRQVYKKGRIKDQSGTRHLISGGEI